VFAYIAVIILSTDIFWIPAFAGMTVFFTL